MWLIKSSTWSRSAGAEWISYWASLTFETGKLMPSQVRRAIMPAAAFQAALLFSTALLQAHEIGTTRVSVLFPGDRTYEIE